MLAQILLSESNKMREKYPFCDPQQMAKQEDIRIYYKDLGKVPGLFTYVLNFPVIILNEKLNETSINTIVAHELGHFVLHKELIKKRTILESNLFDSTSITEYEANAFASHIIIDTDKLLDLAKNYEYDYHELCSFFGCEKDLLFIKIMELQKLGYTLKLPAIPNSKFLKSMYN